MDNQQKKQFGLSYFNKIFTNRPVIYLTVSLTVITLIIIRPLWSQKIAWDAGGDFINHAILVREASSAIQEGQFPIFIAPHLFKGYRYAVFQYYSIIPYVAGAVINIALKTSAYKSMLLVIFFAFILAGIGIYRLVLYWDISKKAAIIVSFAYAFSSYSLVNLYARIAFPEIVYFSLLPWLFYCSLKCYKEKNKKWVGLNALMVSIAFLTHKIFIPWTIFFLLFLLLGNKQKTINNWIALASSWLLGIIASLAYWLPAYSTYSKLVISLPNLMPNPFTNRFLSNPKLLFSPFFAVSSLSGTPGLATQLGLHFLLASICILFIKINTKLKISLFVAISIVIIFAWSPFDVWLFIPIQFQAIQFPYRLIGFATLFGAIALGILLNRFNKSVYFKYFFLSCLILILGITFHYYRPPTFRNVIASTIEKGSNAFPEQNYTYIYKQQKTTRLKKKRLINNKHVKYGKITTVDFFSKKNDLYIFPIYYYPFLSIKEGRKKITYSHYKEYLALQLKKGVHHLKIKYTGMPIANAFSALGLFGIALLLISKKKIQF